MTDSDTAVLDRIVDGTTAVLLCEADGTVVDERTLPVERLPEEGRHEGAVFELELEDETVRTVTYRPAETADRRAAMQERFDRLANRLGEE
ncbi:DUF3006 domain-containing protein [Natronorubrum sulfidifaciens]|uniref:DUF3006 domain-containing protein n=1 Tax=Natronorubrum sulfidifaciens JCM 14089 TaxID=1230460 RepID=L9WCP7_9EURY|nr:DUF3006 domain-containing protein [Natronorubrum sulfidifaciens]ELY47275.1 hypothetical protein C495_03417 [Natronorubrum sulfidifaciens JCM 14089]